MENSLHPDETIDAGIRRIYSGLLDKGISMVRPPSNDIHDTVHNTRKSFKFIRALHRLVKFQLGTERYEKENYAFRDLGRLVSELRDNHVMIVMLHHVASEAHSVRKQDISAGVELLQERERQALEHALGEEKRLEKIEWGLISAGRRLKEEWPEIPDTMESLLPGLAEVYAKGRTGYNQTEEAPEKEHFHEWRKQVKYLLHQHEILARYWPEDLGLNGTTLVQLSDYLGEEHDLALFLDLLGEREFNKNLDKVEALISYSDQKRTFLQRSALNIGGFVYAKPGDEFISFFRESKQLQ